MDVAWCGVAARTETLDSKSLGSIGSATWVLGISICRCGKWFTRDQNFERHRLNVVIGTILSVFMNGTPADKTKTRFGFKWQYAGFNIIELITIRTREGSSPKVDCLAVRDYVEDPSPLPPKKKHRITRKACASQRKSVPPKMKTHWLNQMSAVS